MPDTREFDHLADGVALRLKIIKDRRKRSEARYEQRMDAWRHGVCPDCGAGVVKAMRLLDYFLPWRPDERYQCVACKSVGQHFCSNAE